MHLYAGRSAAVMVYMQQHVRRPLRLLRYDNYATFAEIFTTALLQAAATGETLLASQQTEYEQVLQKQADKDASKMFRLNQRMQVGCPYPCLSPPPPPPPLPCTPPVSPLHAWFHPVSAAKALCLICHRPRTHSMVNSICLHARMHLAVKFDYSNHALSNTVQLSCPLQSQSCLLTVLLAVIMSACA